MLPAEAEPDSLPFVTEATTYIALLRGINVGGRNRLPMADLRDVLTELGHADVRTYVQSGNAVFTSTRTDPAAIGSELTQRLSADLDISPSVMVRSAEDLAAVVGANPYVEHAEADPATVHVAFLSGPPDPDLLDIDDQYAPEQLAVGDGVVYLHLPDGMGRSRLATTLSRRRSGAEMTVRNWRTVTKLHEMARGS